MNARAWDFSIVRCLQGGEKKKKGRRKYKSSRIAKGAKIKVWGWGGQFKSAADILKKRKGGAAGPRGIPDIAIRANSDMARNKTPT